MSSSILFEIQKPDAYIRESLLSAHSEEMN